MSEQLQFKDKVWEKGFAQTPNIVLHNNAISIPARFLYALLCSYAWGNKSMVYPGQTKLAEEMGCSARTIRTYLQELKANKLISWKKRGFNKTNIYYLEVPMKIRKISRQERKPTSAPKRKPTSAQLGSPLPTNNTRRKNTNLNIQRERGKNHSLINKKNSSRIGKQPKPSGKLYSYEEIINSWSDEDLISLAVSEKVPFDFVKASLKRFAIYHGIEKHALVNISGRFWRWVIEDKQKYIKC